MKKTFGLCLLLVLVLLVSGGFVYGSGLRSGDADGMSFFHAEGQDLVSDSSGEKVAFRGVNLNGLEFGSFFDNPYPGVEGTNYFKPRPEDLDSLKAWGFNVIRVPFEWARLVPGWYSSNPLPSTLNPTYLAILDDVVRMAREQEIYVILDMHDFLKYWSGRGAQVCVGDHPAYQQLLARTWQLLAEHFRDEPAVLGYDIMNEPVRQEGIEPCGSCGWHTIAQTVVDAIRTVDTNHLILVEGVNYSLASDWSVENGTLPFIEDRITPSRIAYSPHVFFDFNNDSRYNESGEETGPNRQWEYYLRDRLMPVINWSIDNNVPIFIGEVNVPCTADWADVLDHAFDNFLETLRLSVTAWHYINPVHCPLGVCPLNLAACAEEHQLQVLQRHPGGPYSAREGLVLTPPDSILYDDRRVNPWDAGSGYWGNVGVTNVCAGESCFLQIEFFQNFDGVKFTRHYGLDTRQFMTLTFQIKLTGAGQQDFNIFTTAPRSDCEIGSDPVYPPYGEQTLGQYLPSRLVGQWQRVEIPLRRIVSPTNFLISGLAFQNMGRRQEVFYLDQIALQGLPMETPTRTPTGTATPTSAATATSTQRATATRSLTATATRTATATVSSTSTATATRTVIRTQTGTTTRTAIPTSTASVTPTSTPTATSTKTTSPTSTATVTRTKTSTPTQTFTATPTIIPISTSTPTLTGTATLTSTSTPSMTMTWTATVTPTGVPQPVRFYLYLPLVFRDQ